MAGRICIVLIIILSTTTARGQSDGRPAHTLTSHIERLLEDAMADGREAFLVDAVTRLRENPLDINAASAEELSQIPGLDAMLARRIVNHRSRTVFASVNDLLQIEGIDEAVLSAMEPFIAVRTKSDGGSHVSSFVKLRTRLARSTSDQRTAEKNGYLGPAEKMYSRITAQVAGASDVERAGQTRGHREPSLDLGFLAEKDPGEANYLDFTSAYVLVNIPEPGIRFILGDYGVDAAQGEVFSSSGSYAGRSNGMGYGGVMREGVRPSLASESSENWRGAAATWLHDPISISVFTSFRARDATVDSNGVVKSWNLDGYHRTERELSTRQGVRENAVGARATMRLAAGLYWGLSWYSLKFDRALFKSASNSDQGNGYSTAGLDMVFTSGASSFSAEVMHRMGKVQSCVATYRWAPDKTLTTSFLVRVCGSESAADLDMEIGRRVRDSKNSPGASFAVRFRPSHWVRISALYDQFRIPGSTSTNVLPANGHEVLLDAECKTAKIVELELRYRHKAKPTHEILRIGDRLDARVDGMVKVTQARASLTVNVMKWIQSRSRLEYSEVSRRFGRGIDRGLMMYHECAFDALKTCSISLRGISFETSSYESRIYEFEEDVPGAFQNPALYGRGFRWYVRGEFRWGSWLTCSVKYAHSEMGSIPEPGVEVETSQLRHDERWSIQLDVRW